MFGIGIGEFVLIAIVLLIVVGPQKLPEVMKTVAKGVRQVRNAADELRDTIGIDELLREPLEPLSPPAQAPVPATDASSVSVELPIEPTALPPLDAQPTMQIDLADISQAIEAPTSSIMSIERTGAPVQTPLEEESTRHWQQPPDQAETRSVPLPETPPLRRKTPLSTERGLEKKVTFPPPSGSSRVAQNPLRQSSVPPPPPKSRGDGQDDDKEA